VTVKTDNVRGDRRETEGEIVLVPDGVTLRGSIGATILRVLQENGVPIGNSCGGLGTCGECKVRFIEEAPAPTAADWAHIDPEGLSEGWRLACRHTLQRAASIKIHTAVGDLDHKALRDMTVPTEVLDPVVRLREASLDALSRDEQRPLTERLRHAFGEDLRIPVPALRRLAELSHDVPANLSVIEHRGEVLDVRAGDSTRICGLALDVGTTTLAAYLFDLQTGQQLGTAASRNPQYRFGADVISRIAHVRRSKGEGLVALNAAVIDGLNGLIDRVAAEASVSAESIYGATVVGNLTMIHLLLAIDPRGIDVSPYVPVFSDGLRLRARAVGLAISPLAVVQTLPAVSAYVGADIVAGILATGLAEREGGTLFLDVGTNGEIVLAVDGQLIACSTAAGPAFEGASIVQGMPALDGAIESVRVQDGHIVCEVIGEAVPVGLCGTGLVSAVAELRSAGIIDPSGRFRDAGSPPSDRFQGVGKERRFRLTDGTRPVYLYQGDIREFQLAKAAIRTGIEVLLQHAGLRAQQLDRVLIGGAFSARMSSEHLIETGFLPEIDASRIHVVGNAAGQGAKQVLLNRALMEEAERLSQCVEYLELSGDPRFSELYVDHIPLPAAPQD